MLSPEQRYEERTRKSDLMIQKLLLNQEAF